MKLKCGHKRRVQVIPHEIDGFMVPGGVLIDRTTVHRDDGSQCDSAFLRLGDKVFAPMQVAVRALEGLPLRGDRLGLGAQWKRDREQLPLYRHK